jgi:hypothetical protein
MENTNTSTNVSFIVQYNNGYFWEECRIFTNIEEAVSNLEKFKKINSDNNYRLIKSEWQIVG